MTNPFKSLALLCAIFFSFTNLFAANILSETDLQISMSADNPNAAIYQYITITTTVENTGSNAATDVVLAFSIPSEVAVAGESAPVVSQGTLSDFYGGSLFGTWSVGTISAGESATFDITFFSLGASNTFYGQVQSMSGTDIDSNPGNSICCEGTEDDEAFLIFPTGSDGGGEEEETEPTCDLDVVYVEHSACFDNGTPDDFSDDYFDLTFRADGVGSYLVEGPFGSLYEETLEYASGFHTISNIPGGLTSTNSGYQIEFTDDSNLLFCDTTVQFAGPCTQTLGFGDLELSASTPDGTDMPGVYSSGTAVFTLRNAGNTLATGIAIPLTKYQINYTGYPQITGGQVTSFYDSDNIFLWLVDDLEPGTEITLSIGVYTLGEEYSVYAQVAGSITLPDIDSANGNGNGTTPMEDDEAVYRLNTEVEENEADLVVTNLIIENDTVVQGEIVNYSFTVKNIGTQASSPVSAIARRSYNEYFSPAYPILNTAAVPALLPQQELTFEFSTSTQGVYLSNYFINVLVDTNNDVAEANETNNEAFAPLLILSPDCTFGIESYEYVCDTTEMGEVFIGVDVVFFNDFDDNVQRINSTDTYYLATGEPVRVTESATGETYILEYQGSSNCLSKIVEFNIPTTTVCEENEPDDLPDLTIGSIEVEDGFAYIADTILYNYSIVNQGASFFHKSITVRTFMSTNNTLGASDVLVEEFTFYLTLGAGDSITLNRNPRLPDQIGGSRRLFISVDANDNMAESDEENNIDFELFNYNDPPCFVNVIEESYACFYLSDTDTLIALSLELETYDNLVISCSPGQIFTNTSFTSENNSYVQFIDHPGTPLSVYFSVADHPTGCFTTINFTFPDEIDCSNVPECDVMEAEIENLACTETKINFDIKPKGENISNDLFKLISHVIGSQFVDNLEKDEFESVSFNRVSDTTFFSLTPSGAIPNSYPLSTVCKDTFGLVCPAISEPEIEFVDLEVELTESPALGIYEQGEVTFTVSNKGTQAATGVVLSFSRQETQTSVVGTPTVTQGSTQYFWTLSPLWNVGTLLPGQSESITINLFILLSDFRYSAYVRNQNEPDIDSYPVYPLSNNDSIDEDDYAVYSGQITGGNDLPDINVYNAAIGSNYLNPTEVLTYEFNVRNDGNVATQTPVNAEVYWSTDAILDAADVSVGTHITQNNLAANTEESITGSFNIADFDLPPGDYYLLTADNSNNEITEENNQISYLSTAFEVIDPQNCNIVINEPNYLCQQAEETYQIIFDLEVENVTSDFFALSYLLNENTADRDLDNGSVVIENIPFGTENTLIISDLENSACADTLTFDYTQDCMDTETFMPDLEVTLEISTLTPQLYVPFTATITLSNTGNTAATDVNVLFQRQHDPTTLTIVGENPYEATAGDVDWYAGWWKFEEVAAGATEVLTVNYFPFAPGTPFIRAYVRDMNEEDPDSEPGSCCTSGEDDEAIFYLAIDSNFSDNNTNNRSSNDNNQSEKALSVYPNPVSDILKITGEPGILHLNDTNGNSIIKQQTDGDTSLNIAHLSKGIYFLTLQTATGNSVVRVVKM